MTISAGWIHADTMIETSNAYLYVIEGTIKGDNFNLQEGDGAELTDNLIARFDAHIILFEESKL